MSAMRPRLWPANGAPLAGPSPLVPSRSLR